MKSNHDFSISFSEHFMFQNISVFLVSLLGGNKDTDNAERSGHLAEILCS